jgi:hypothetical protein
MSGFHSLVSPMAVRFELVAGKHCQRDTANAEVGKIANADRV